MVCGVYESRNGIVKPEPLLFECIGSHSKIRRPGNGQGGIK